MYLQLLHLQKIFPNSEVPAVEDFSLAVRRGESISLMGPSGCGKTTVLRMIAGLETPTSGEILYEGKNVSPIPAHLRNFAMVFQSPSLFPQMNVEQNIAYGLKIRKLKTSEISRKVSEMLELVKLESFRKRMPEELSGGQQQRVALARAIVVEPRLLLLDEPLANLDQNLKKSLREDIRKIQKLRNQTAIYVTHDAAEASEISDRVIEMEPGQAKNFRPLDLLRKY